MKADRHYSESDIEAAILSLATEDFTPKWTGSATAETDAQLKRIELSTKIIRALRHLSEEHDDATGETGRN